MSRLHLASLLGVALVAAAAGIVRAEEVEESPASEAASLLRRDLPDDFPFQVFDAGFAVVRVRITNQSEAPLELDPAAMEFFGPNRKRLNQAEPTEITPKIIKYYNKSGGSLPVHGDVSYGYPYPPYPGAVHATRRPGSTTGDAGRIDAGTGPALRETLLRYQFKPISLAPGEQAEGFVYLKSNKSGNALSGGWVQVDGQRIDFRNLN